MNLIVILASLFLDRSVDPGRALRSLDFIHDTVRKGLTRAGDNSLFVVAVIALTLVLPALAAHWIGLLISGAMFGLLTLLWSIAVLFICYSFLPVETELAAYLDAIESGDAEIADDRARRLSGEAHFDSDSARNTAVAKALFSQVNTHWVAVIFWFILLGPFGAVLYRLTLQLTLQPQLQTGIDDDMVRRLATLLGLLTWLPARIVLLAYALAGQFEDTLNSLLGPRLSEPDASLFDDNNTALAEAGTRALGGLDDIDKVTGEEVRAAHRLILRALLLCLAVVALLTLAGWFA